jgi:hypothetical protein
MKTESEIRELCEIARTAKKSFPPGSSENIVAGAIGAVFELILDEKTDAAESLRQFFKICQMNRKIP